MSRMKIVLDMQARQSQGSHHRGIGRYALALGQAMARQAGDQIHLLVNAAFPHYGLEIREDFSQWIDPQRIHVFHAPQPAAGLHPENGWRIRAAEQLREGVLQALQPDIVHISSLFEGVDDDVVTSVWHPALSGKTSITLHDLIPLMQADHYLRDPRMQAWYYRKLQSLKNTGLLLAVSEYSRREGIEVLGLDPQRVVCAPNAVSAEFRRLDLTQEQAAAVRAKFGLARAFILYMGGVEYRKNIERLVAAYASLPAPVRAQHALVIAGKVKDYEHDRLLALQHKHGLSAADFILTGPVSDEELVELYNLAALFVFPSLYEGFGLPVLEAMACGCPTIAANNSSLPEVAGWDEALFDGLSVESMGRKMAQALSDTGFRMALQAHAEQHIQRFSWDASATVALEAFAALHGQQQASGRVQVAIRLPEAQRPRLAFVAEFPENGGGAAHFNARLLPALAAFYDIELVSNQPEVGDLWLRSNFPLRSRQWLRDHSAHYQRRAYAPDPDAYDPDLLTLMQEQPGTLLLHRFQADAWRLSPAMRYQAHGYTALLPEGRETQATYPGNRPLLEAALGVIALEADAQQLAQDCYGAEIARYWRHLAMEPLAEQALGVSHVVGEQFAQALETFHAQHPWALEQQVARRIQALAAPVDAVAADWLAVAQSLADNRLAWPPAQPVLFYDVSIFVWGDHATGVHRATRSILLALLKAPPAGWRVEPIYAHEGHYRYARRMTAGLLGVKGLDLSDSVVDFRAGDKFLHVDLGMHIVADMEPHLQKIRACGVQVYHLVHDILPMRLPQEFFDAGVLTYFRRWLEAVCRVADGLIMTTQAGLEDVAAWMRENPPQRFGQPRLGVCTLGADIQADAEALLDGQERALLETFRHRPTFLMVSTIEPRKGYGQALKAFEWLWEQGVDAQLVLVGKQGWNVEPLMAAIQQHPELGKRLHWMKFVSNTMLAGLYENCSALLMASEGEGFGLPLIEAAQHNLPVIARNIPVFREIAGEHAFYFAGTEPQALADAIQRWLALRGQGQEPKPSGIRWITWEDSAEQIKAFLLGGQARGGATA